MPSCNSWPLEQWYDQFVPFFVFIAGSCSFVWLYHNLFSSSHRVGYLHYFLFLSIMNKQPWTFPDRCSYRHALSFLLSKQLGVKFLAHRMGVQPLPWPPLWLACFSSALSGLPSCPSGGSSGMKLQQAFCGGASGTSLQISEQGVGVRAGGSMRLEVERGWFTDQGPFLVLPLISRQVIFWTNSSVALQDSFQMVLYLSWEYIVAAHLESVSLGRTETNTKFFLFLLTSETWKLFLFHWFFCLLIRVDIQDDLLSFVTRKDDRDANGGGGYKRAETRRRGRLQKKSKEQKGKTGLRGVGGFACVCVCV